MPVVFAGEMFQAGARNLGCRYYRHLSGGELILFIQFGSTFWFQTPQSQSGCNFDAKYYLLYYYYGGMIYLAVRNLDRALYFFEVAITTPARAFSHIMLEAYKKYILVSLLLNGKVSCYFINELMKIDCENSFR